MNAKDCCCIIIGGYINGYSIIQELYTKKIFDIIYIDFQKDIAYYSKKVIQKHIIKSDPQILAQCLQKIHKTYNHLILFPTHDMHLVYLRQILDNIKGFCHIAFNPDTIIQYQSKSIQYQYCEQLGVPYPKSLFIETYSDIKKIVDLSFPIIIKPALRDEIKESHFRSWKIENHQDLRHKIDAIRNYITIGYSLVASEIIPGDSDNIYAYVAYRQSNGAILAEWTGKKLSQFPNNFGVFATACAVENATVRELGRKLLNGMNLWGISEPEFKYDSRDNKYKLMEINLRPMMWHRVGFLNGVNLNYIQYMDLQGLIIDHLESKPVHSNIHYVNVFYEFLLLIKSPKYIKGFWNNVFGSTTDIAGFDKHDIYPFLYLPIVIVRKIFNKLCK